MKLVNHCFNIENFGRYFVSLILFFLPGVAFGITTTELRTGDIVFQQSQSHQSRAIREVTGSPWIHIGIVVRQGRLDGGLIN